MPEALHAYVTMLLLSPVAAAIGLNDKVQDRFFRQSKVRRSGDGMLWCRLSRNGALESSILEYLSVIQASKGGRLKELALRSQIVRNTCHTA